MSVNINNIINNCSIEKRQKIISDLTIDYQETEFGRKPSFHLFEIDETPFYKNIYSLIKIIFSILYFIVVSLPLAGLILLFVYTIDIVKTAKNALTKN